MPPGRGSREVCHCHEAMWLQQMRNRVYVTLRLTPLALAVKDACMWDKIGQKCALSLPSNLWSANERRSPWLLVPQADNALQCKKQRGAQGGVQSWWSWSVKGLLGVSEKSFRVCDCRNAALRSTGWYCRVPAMLEGHRHSWRTVVTHGWFCQQVFFKNDWNNLH